MSSTPRGFALRGTRFVERVLFLNCQRKLFSTSADQKNSGERHRLELQATDLLDVYRGLVSQGRLKFDEEQIRVVMELRRLQKRLKNYVPQGLISSHFYTKHKLDGSNNPWWSHSAEVRPAASEVNAVVHLKGHVDDIADLETPKGLFVTGHPGSGKSMLVDLWFSIVPIAYKARKHYSTLIIEIYQAVWDETRRRQAFAPPTPTPQTLWNKAVRERWRSLFASGGSPPLKNPNIPSSSHSMPSISYSIARRLLLNHWLLVFDEVQLLDVSSAGLLSDVLSWFWRMGGVVVGTSNKVPDDLYRNGVQRERLEPFVEALKLRCPVMHLKGTADYRKIKASRRQRNTWFTRGQEKEFQNTIFRLGRGESAVSKNINIFGRDLSVGHISDTMCQFKFKALCDQSLGSADYISIASRYSTIVLTDVPVLRADAMNQGRRFISLIDALYESRCQLVCLAESDLDGLFFPGKDDGPACDDNESLMMAESISETTETFRPNVSSYSSLPSSGLLHREPLRLETLSIFSGEEERFAYQRAYSRLLEMTSVTCDDNEYEWKPLPGEVRTWETSIVDKEVSSESSFGDDFFENQASRFQPEQERERPPAPKLGEEHFWGVREDWGPRAKGWGRGAAVHNKIDGDDSRGNR